MRRHARTLFFVCAGTLAFATTANAQWMDQLKGALGGGDTPSVSAASPANIGGLLQYCIKSDYVGGQPAETVQSGLMRKLTGTGQGPQTPQYQAGTQGVLQSGGQSLDLSGGGIKEQIARQVCSKVLEYARSLL